MYVTGFFGADGTTATATFGPATLTAAGSTDAFVAGMDSSGAWLWAQRAGGATSQRPRVNFQALAEAAARRDNHRGVALVGLAEEVLALRVGRIGAHFVAVCRELVRPEGALVARAGVGRKASPKFFFWVSQSVISSTGHCPRFSTRSSSQALAPWCGGP